MEGCGGDSGGEGGGGDFARFGTIRRFHPDHGFINDGAEVTGRDQGLEVLEILKLHVRLHLDWMLLQLVEPEPELLVPERTRDRFGLHLDGLNLTRSAEPLGPPRVGSLQRAHGLGGGEHGAPPRVGGVGGSRSRLGSSPPGPSL